MGDHGCQDPDLDKTLRGLDAALSQAWSEEDQKNVARHEKGSEPTVQQRVHEELGEQELPPCSEQAQVRKPTGDLEGEASGAGGLQAKVHANW